jgi:hypothetical protein
MSFERDFQLSEQAQPYQNKIYQNVFPVDEVVRYQKGEDNERHVMDRYHHIDVEVVLQNGSKLLGQEKALRNRFASYNTFTIEFYQNEHTKERGEFFNLGSQFYLHSYWNKEQNGFVKWYLIKVFDFILWLKEKPIEELEQQTRSPGSSRASFYYIDYADIPERFIYESHKDESTGLDRYV